MLNIIIFGPPGIDKLLDFKQISIAQVLALNVSEEELVKRILNRGKTSGRADDNDETTIRQRVTEYENKTAPVADYYNHQKKLVRIPGEGTIETTFDLLVEQIDHI